MRFEPRIMNVPDNRWGVWDHAAEEWRETMLGTTDEADARLSAEVLNGMPDGYSFGVRLSIRRPPRVVLVRHMVGGAFVVAALQLTAPGNWSPPGPAVGFLLMMLTLAVAWWKLITVERYTPDVHMRLEMNPSNNDEEEESQ